MPSKKQAKIEKLQTLQRIKQTCDSLNESNSNVDELKDVVVFMQDENDDISNAARKAVSKLFVHLLQTKRMFNSPEIKLVECYGDVKDTFLNILGGNNDDNILNLCFDSLFKLLINEGKYPINDVKYPYFPAEFLTSILKCILRDDRDMSSIISKYVEYLQFDDVKCYTVKSLRFLLKNRKTSEVSEQFMCNVFALLSAIRFPILGKIRKKQKKRKEDDGVEVSQLLCESLNDELPKFRFDYENTADIFASVWLLFISFTIPRKLFRKILIILDDHVMPHFRNPLSLSDFLINSFNVGGSVSLLALSSLFILIQKCNLEYPDFYPKLYSLLEPNILYVKYRARFFFWTDVFLSSTHLPAYIVAAFIKRLSRMTLTAPVDALMIMIPLIENLFVRHPNLDVLFNRKEKGSITDDPFDNEEGDLSKCNAMNSSLWEIRTLQNHWHPKVAQLASFIDKPVAKQENDLSEILEITFDEIINEEFSKELSDESQRLNKNKLQHLWSV